MRAGSKLAVAGVMVGVVAALGVTVLGPASPASAATGCGSRCDDKDPQTFVWKYVGPSPGQPVTCQKDAVDKRVKTGVILRYSPSCRTAWAKNVAGEAGAGSRYFVEVQRFAVGGSSVNKRSTGSAWSDMVNDAGYESRACLYISYGADSEPALIRCTDKY
jgi:hypothetical protein